MSDLFDRAWVDGSKISFKKLTEHTESKVTFNQYLFDLVFLRKESEFFKINFAVTAPKSTRSKEEEITIQVGNYRIAKFITSFSRRVYSQNNPRVLNKFRPDLSRFVKEITVKPYRRKV
jgi:hypothetical protein